jgi:NAD(P)-dependent dehydrogenase (short-subunit alcohol dehydrogenase family)
MDSTGGEREEMIATEPVGRVRRPEEVAETVVWLCGKGASFTTRQAITVDEGWTECVVHICRPIPALRG